MHEPTSSAPVGAMYERDGDRFLPTALTAGPWDPRAQGGSATCALLAWAVEQVPTLAPMRTVRGTFDLLRPAPLEPLTVTTSVLREGKRIQVVDAALRAGDVLVGTCRALRLRRGAVSPPDVDNPFLEPVTVPPPPPGPEKWPPTVDRSFLPGIMGAFEVRVPEPAPAFPTTMWVRLRAEVVAGSPPTPMAFLAAVADFTSNSATHADPMAWSMINADVSVDIVREHIGDWLAVVARSAFGPDGIGHSTGRIYDGEGLVATAMTMGLVEPVGQPFARPRQEQHR